jgi:nucleoside-diphosphate-sugar epimerase
MHVLIAGVGWLGRGIARECLANGWRVSGVKRTPGGLEELSGLGVAPVVADLADPRSLEHIPRDIDAIVACQAASGDAPEDYRRAYLDVNRNLLELAGVSPAPALVYTSSTGVFGQRDGGDVDETTPAQPAGESSEILVEAERLVLGAAGRIVRLSGLYGPGRTGTIDRVRRGALALGPGDDAWMNFCHLDDAVATVLGAIRQGRPGAVYHASDAGPARRRDVVLWIAGRLGIEPAVVPEGGSLAPAGRRGANRRILADRTRAELELTLRWPTFREGLAPFLPSPS